MLKIALLMPEDGGGDSQNSLIELEHIHAPLSY